MTEFDHSGKRFLITGGTGSFGQRMARRLLDQDCASVRVFSRDEAKQHDMRLAFNDGRLEFHVGDVRDQQSVEHAMHDIDSVFHAAALKQVPSCEFFPLQAVLTNILGSANVVEAAQRRDVESVVCLSTDKAVLPVNAMGMTKALMEKVAQSSARRTLDGTRVCSVRYGNVLYSRGSVVPLFVSQAQQGKPLTVTDPEMTRFLLRLDEAVELVEYAIGRGRPGDVFIRKAPSATIGDVAAAVQGLFGTTLPTEHIGVRHGEKLYETLATAEELRHAEDLGDFWRIEMDDRGLNYDQYFSEGEMVDDESRPDFHSHNAVRLDVEDVMTTLARVPQIAGLLEAQGRR